VPENFDGPIACFATSYLEQENACNKRNLALATRAPRNCCPVTEPFRKAGMLIAYVYHFPYTWVTIESLARYTEGSCVDCRIGRIARFLCFHLLDLHRVNPTNFPLRLKKKQEEKKSLKQGKEKKKKRNSELHLVTCKAFGTMKIRSASRRFKACQIAIPIRRIDRRSSDQSVQVQYYVNLSTMVRARLKGERIDRRKQGFDVAR
jgi:hypothetical protein